MNVLLIGSGGREHALAYKISSSPLLGKLFCAPGNPGTLTLGDNIELDVKNHKAVVEFCKKNTVELVVIGPEAPLVDGLADSLRDNGLLVVGPSKLAARLEGSKGFTKDLCAKYNIPTGAYQRFKNANEAKDYIRKKGAPIVIKADGLAAGKGVTVALTIGEALDAVDACFDGAFGKAGIEIVVEEFLEGEEASFFCLCDGKTAIPFGSAQDHKRVGDGDKGANTGGMGAYSPAPVMTEDMTKRVMNEIVEPTIRGMADLGCPFSGVLFVGLMITKKGPELIEFNVRFGDPECQVLMMRLKSDLLPVLSSVAKGHLEDVELNWTTDKALTVVMAAKGYPQAPQRGSIISGIEKADKLPDVKVFHAGTALKDGKVIANGGRVLNVTATGKTVKEAQQKAYQAIKLIDWPEGFYRHDIGWRAIEREESKAS
ncbi:phosphoribosylamine--glycine ligase [Bartonella sp. M0283]|uniref:phosphoribosylamine--glycine ligase n=1 Tax=Bartonella sp. M0283 TaxID=2751016 RepID=UPI0018DC9F45|nr:phosphoribosylamine--glycine ligase [Bartonella sp. M0283]MBI0163205.1 phosphoribosylamine--glycine ligase [Bartonella sp. M0283]